MTVGGWMEAARRNWRGRTNVEIEFFGNFSLLHYAYVHTLGGSKANNTKGYSYFENTGPFQKSYLGQAPNNRKEEKRRGRVLRQEFKNQQGVK